jgi:hypothetical protein
MHDACLVGVCKALRRLHREPSPRFTINPYREPLFSLSSANPLSTKEREQLSLHVIDWTSNIILRF